MALGRPGQFSMPFLAAVMLRQGSFGWSDFEKYLPDQGILDTCKIVVPVQDDRVEPPATNNFAATVAITTADGSVHETIVPVPSGEPSVFPTSQDLVDKFVGLVSLYCADGEAEARVIAKGWLEAEKAGSGIYIENDEYCI